jgi:hypothetical protein
MKKLIFVILFFCIGCASAIFKRDQFLTSDNSASKICNVPPGPRGIKFSHESEELELKFTSSKSRPIWVGLPFIPFIPTFNDGNKFADLRVVVSRKIKGKEVKAPENNWYIKLPSGQIKGNLDENNVLTFEFEPIDVEQFDLFGPSLLGQSILKVHVDRKVDTHYMPFAYGLVMRGGPISPDGCYIPEVGL